MESMSSWMHSTTKLFSYKESISWNRCLGVFNGLKISCSVKTSMQLCFKNDKFCGSFFTLSVVLKLYDLFCHFLNFFNKRENEKINKKISCSLSHALVKYFCYKRKYFSSRKSYNRFLSWVRIFASGSYFQPKGSLINVFSLKVFKKHTWGYIFKNK